MGAGYTHSRLAEAHEAQGLSPEHFMRRTLQLLHLQPREDKSLED